LPRPFAFDVRGKHQSGTYTVRMLYQNYQLLANVGDPLRVFADHAQSIFRHWADLRNVSPLRRMAAYYEQIALMGFTHTRPAFGITPVPDIHGNDVPVAEEVVMRTPFCHLLRFRKATDETLPRVLLVAPMSGHFATLLRGTVQTLARDHEVYITDWLNIRDIPQSAGRFGFDAYVEHVMDFLRFMGPQSHLMGVCQPTVACLAAAAVMAEDKDTCTPASLILLAGPIDTRINPTQVNELAMSKPIEWFRKNLIGTVPFQFAGAGRRVYPGFLQLMAFMNTNLDRHRKSFQDLFTMRIRGEHDKADLIRDFYKEYFAIMDLSAEFYLETVESVFQTHLLPKGELKFRDRLVRPEALRRTFLLTVEGERDDICGMGQTLAAQDLCSKLPPYMKTHHLQAGVGHYGVFAGKRWTAQIYPVVRETIINATS
jgi:poly(3-hydroxybutyrate) depolymerase